MDVEEFRKFGKAAIDYLVNYFETIRERPVLPSVEPGYLQHLIPKEVPENPEKWEDILKDIERVIMPGVTHWKSPRFHAYFPASSSFPSIVGELIAAGLGLIGFSWMTSPACTELEVITMDWLGKLMNLPKAFLSSSEGPGGGIIQGSASESTFVCLLAAKHRKLTSILKTHPDWDEALIRGKMVAYTSEQANSSVEKAGILGSMKMRLLETDNKGSVRGETLMKAIQEDIEKGLIPTYFCATLGTTVSCAFDNMDEIGPICNSHDIWLHIDAAYAGAAFVCPEYWHLMSGIHFADSFNFNPHKWLLVNFDCSALWVKNSNWFVDAFRVERIYLKHKKQGIAQSAPDYRDWQIPLGRRFRSLKLWITLRVFGQVGIQNFIRRQVRLAKEFETLAKRDSRFETMDAVMGLVCFRLKGPNELTHLLQERLLLRGNIYTISGILDNKFFIRFVVCSESTVSEDIHYSWNEIQSQAESILLEHQNGTDKLIEEN